MTFAGVTIPSFLVKFDPETNNKSKSLLDFLNRVFESDMIMHLLLIIGSSDLAYTRCNIVSKSDSMINSGDFAKKFIINQQEHRVNKLGLTKLRAIELLHSIFQRLYPTFGALVTA